MTSSRKSTQTRKSKGSNFLPHEMCEQCTGVLFADYDKSIRQARLQFFETCRALFSQAHPGRLVHHQVCLPFFALFDAFVRGRAAIGSGREIKLKLASPNVFFWLSKNFTWGAMPRYHGLAQGCEGAPCSPRADLPKSRVENPLRSGSWSEVALSRWKTEIETSKIAGNDS